MAMGDWYQLTEGTELMQGDILPGVPILRFPRDVPWPIGVEAEAQIEWESNDAVIVSQSCDLVERQKADMWLVAVCPVWTLSELSAVNPYLASSAGREQCRRGNLPGYHMLAGHGEGSFEHEVSIVSFREIWSLPIDFARRFAEGCGPRTRMRSPYREHLGQAFARYFMRVGLPSDIPRFDGPKDEERALAALGVLDPTARARVVAASGLIE